MRDKQSMSSFTGQVNSLSRTVQQLQHSKAALTGQLEAEKCETAALERRLAAQVQAHTFGLLHEVHMRRGFA